MPPSLRKHLLSALSGLFVGGLLSCTSHPKVTFPPASVSQPSIVQAVTTSAADGAVTVRWAPNDPAEQVTSYDVYSAAANFSTWASSLPEAQVATSLACCSFVRTALSNDRTYWFAVAATNVRGVGPSSPPISALPPGWPGIRVWGTATEDRSNGIAIDSAGDLYVAGSTRGVVGPEGNAGGEDGVLLKYDRRGRLLWAHQWGTSGDDEFNGVSVVPGGGVFVTGIANIQTAASGIIARFEPDGTLNWLKQVSGIDGFGIVENGGDLFVALASYTTYGTFWTGGSNAAAYCGDAAVGQYDTAGNFVWGEQIGSAGVCSNSQATDVANGVAVDPNGITIAGQTNGTFQNQTAGGGYDFFVSRFRRSDGTYLWTRQLGSSGDDVAFAAAADLAGNSYVVGYTFGTMPSCTSSGGLDAVVASWSSSGSLRWATQFGTPGNDQANAVVLTSAGLIVAGSSDSGPIGSVTQDIFIARLDPATGHLLEIHPRVDPSGNESAAGVSDNPAGSTFVTGTRQLPTSSTPDGIVVKFDASGNPL